jgi:hypothetical protein
MPVDDVQQVVAVVVNSSYSMLPAAPPVPEGVTLQSLVTPVRFAAFRKPSISVYGELKGRFWLLVNW